MSDGTTGTSPYRIFRNRTFTRLWFANLISVGGTALTSLAGAILVYQLTGSALHVGLVLLAAALPALLVGPFAGVVVDRYDRKQIMVAADLLRAALVLGMPFAAQLGLGWLYLLVILAGAAGQFFEPAHQSVLPEVAEEDELAAANSFMEVSTQLAWALGFAAAGMFAALGATALAFYIDAASFLISAACIATTTIRPAQTADVLTAGAVVRELREGVGFMVGRAELRSLLLLRIPVALSFGLTNALLLPFAMQGLGTNEFEYGLLEGVASIGILTGGLLMAHLAQRLREGQWLALGLVVMAVEQLLVVLLGSLPLAILLMLLGGVANAPVAIAGRLLIQRCAPEELRGRVFSAYFIINDLGIALGMVAAGLADVVDVRLLFLLAGLPLLLAGAMALSLPGLRAPAAAWRTILGRVQQPTREIGEAA